MRVLPLVLFLAAAGIPVGGLSAQGAARWKAIGTTVTGNAVFVDPRSVRTADSIVTATIRVVYTTPVETPKGPITGTRVVAMFNCARRTVAVKESIIWHDEAKGLIYEKRVPKQPGFGTVFTSNFSGVAHEYLCAPKAGGTPKAAATPKPGEPGR